MEGVRLLTPRFAAWGRCGNILAWSDGVGWPAGWPHATHASTRNAMEDLTGRIDLS
jgi:hypothetical protein